MGPSHHRNQRSHPRDDRHRTRTRPDATTERCTALGLAHAAECLSDLVEEASRENLSPLGFFHRILEREIERKTERRVATSLKLSGLPTGKTLEGFDWTFQPRADRSKLEMLATCAFLRARENVLFLGPPCPATHRHQLGRSVGSRQ